MRVKVTWHDAKREPTGAPNPRYPKGVDIDISDGATKTCQVPLEYPAPRCGTYVLYCPICDLRMTVSTAGRADDPRSVRVACKPARPQ